MPHKLTTQILASHMNFGEAVINILSVIFTGVIY